MAEFPALPLWTDAYLGDTRHLTTTEHGAYFLLIVTAWRTRDCKLPDDDKMLARYAGLTMTQWRRMRPTIQPFFRVEGGFWKQSRLTDEYNAVRQKRESAAANGRASALKRKDRHSTERHASENEASTTISLPLPIESNLPIPSTETARDESAQPANEPATQPPAGQAGRAEDLAHELAGMVGLQLVTPQAITANVATVQAWLADGIEPETCRAVVRTCAANGGGADTRSLRRFDAVIRHDHAKRNPNAQPPAKPLPIAEQIRYFEDQAARATRIGQADTAAEWLSKAEKLKLGIAA